MDIEIKKIIGSTDSGTPDTGKSAKEKINDNFASLLNAIKEFNGENEYLHKDKPDTAQELITFLKGLITDELKSTDYTAGAFGSGMRMWMQDGQSHAEIDNLHVRMEAIFNKLTIAELQSVGGQVVLSVADLQCVKVTEYDTYYRCYFDTKDGTIPNRWAINDQARCQNWNGNQKFYWRLVVSVGANYIDLSKIDCNGSGVPEARDAIVQLGNRTDLARQNAIVLSAYGVDAPSITQYEGIHSYTTDGCEVTVISPKGNKITGDLRVKSGNKIIPIPADRGAFVSGETYRYYDRVSHDGALWLCVIAEGKTTTESPTDGAQAWLKQVDKGADGKDAGVNLLKWQDEWKEGALPAGWELNGLPEENSVIYGENPFKVRSLMWKCKPNLDGHSSGGFHTPSLIVDGKYAHRFSTFVFRIRSGNGNIYHGCYGLDDLNDTENGNPYFWSGDLPALEWFLMVGYIHPKGSVVKTNLSGVYNMQGKKLAEGSDFKFRQPNVEIRPRNYLYHSNMPAGEVYFYNPMLHKLDGTEPSIEQMLQLSTRKEIDEIKTTYDKKFESTDKQFTSVLTETKTYTNNAIAASEENAKQYVKEQNYSTIKQTAESINLSINNIKVGGNNLFSKKTPIGKLDGEPNYYRNESEAPDGFVMIGAKDRINGIRINGVIKSNGEYTVSFWAKGSWNTSVYVDVCDISPTRIDFTDSWQYYSLTVNVTNYSDSVYNFVDFSGIPGVALYVKKLKIEKGNIATDWSLSQEELPTIDTIIASINLSKEEALINAERIRLKGKTVADAIQTDGLNVGDKTSIDKYGNLRTVNATISGSISMPFKRVTYQLGTSYVPDLSDIYNLIVYATPSANAADNWIVISLPDASLYNGRVFNIFNNTTYIEGRTPINLTVIANPPNYPYNKIRVIGYGELVTFTSVGDGWFFHNQYREVIN